MTAIVVVGDALLDRDVLGTVERLSPDAPVPVVDQDVVHTRPGGAGLAALLAAGDADTVTLVTALGDDPAGAELRRLLAEHGIDVVDLGLDGATPEKVRIGTPGRPLLRLDAGGGGAVGEPDAAVRAAIGWADAVLVADYGRGVADVPAIRAQLALAASPVVWDPHPRGAEPVAGATLVTPNLAEARCFKPGTDNDATPAVARRAHALAARWQARAVCVTCGARGAVLVHGDGPPLAVPAEAATDGDACGAGDRFASRVAVALADGASTVDAVVAAVAAASRFVAAGGAAAVAGPRQTRSPAACENGDRYPVSDDDAGALAERVRSRGGTVVATGGCFDLLHPGHIRTLQAARALGDCLVVCMNSDASARRLKGAGRPVVAERDRAAVLRALACVDAVVVFDEDTPAAALERLRPDVWAKGGDYAGRELPEAAVLARWGGEVVLVPFLHGKSTTRIIEEASLHAMADLRSVIITGGASGLGAAIAHAVRDAGLTPVVFDIDPSANGFAAHAVDVSDTRATEAAVDAVAREHGGLRGVVTAAGIDACGRLDDIDGAAWERVIAVNLLGTAAVARAALPHLERSAGRVVTVASTLGLKAVSDATAYCASKFGVVGFTRALAAETAGRVGVTLLIPGGMSTHFFDGRPDRYKPGPDARLADPNEIAQAVVFALGRPAGVELREIVMAADTEPSWP